MRHERVYVDDRHYFYADRNDGTGHLYFQEGGFEPHIRRELERLIPTCHGFLDIGANVGLHVVTAKSIQPGLPVVAIEVNPDTSAILTRALGEQNINDVAVITAAVAERCCTVQANVSYSNAVCAHLGIWGKDDAGYAPAIALDALDLSHIDLVKIDIDGWEWRAFYGATKLMKQRPTVIFEYHLGVIERGGIKGPELLNFFTARDYMLTTLTGNRENFYTAGYAHEHIVASLDGVTDLLATPL